MIKFLIFIILMQFLQSQDVINKKLDSHPVFEHKKKKKPNYYFSIEKKSEKKFNNKGVSFHAFKKGLNYEFLTPLFLFKNKSKLHYYSIDKSNIPSGFKYSKIVFYVFKEQIKGTTPIYQYKSKEKRGGFKFEISSAPPSGFEAVNSNAVAFYALSEPGYIDCDRVLNGNAFIDECGVCSDGGTGHLANSDKDCFGDCFGNAYENECGCVGGNSLKEKNYCYGCTDTTALNYNEIYSIEDNNCIYGPKAAIRVSSIGKDIKISDNSSIGTYKIIKWLWNVGDEKKEGKNIDEVNFKYTYDDYGSYDITLEVEDEVGNKDKTIQTVKISKLVQSLTRFDINKNKIIEINFSDQKLNGIQNLFFENNDLKATYNFVDGKLHGLQKTFYKGKIIKSKLEFENGKQHGLHEYFDNNGKILRQISFENGEPMGVFKAFYPKTYNKHIEIHYNKGTPEKIYFWDENGFLIGDKDYESLMQNEKNSLNR